MPAWTRRRVLELAGLGGAWTLAGCLGTDPAGDDRGITAQASFFVFGDLAARVGGDHATAETVVPVGQHGHGWEPGPRVRATILEADLFVHGVPGFQPWADEVVRDLRSEASDVTAVGVADGIDLLAAGSDADDHDDHGDADDDETDDGHDHGGAADPHFWLDPVRTRAAVDNIRNGFVAVDAAHRERYAANASGLRDRLDDLDGQLRAVVADAARDVVLVAGHDAFGYLRDRYDLEIVALTGLAADDQPSPRDIERAQELIEAHGLEHVCADPLESQRAAEQLVAETDARTVLPLTAMPGRTQAWAADGWGYLDVMANVNLSTLERALDVR